MTIGEIIAGGTAIVAILIAARQLYETRIHNKVLLRPCLIPHRHIINRKILKVTLQNVGLGPAEIISFQYELNGKTYDELEEALQDLKISLQVKSMTTYSAKPGSVIPASKEVTLFEAEFVDSSHFEELEKTIEADVKIRYSSWFGEEYKL